MDIQTANNSRPLGQPAMTAFRTFAYASALLNLYYNAIWIISYNRFDTHAQKIEVFRDLTLHMPALLLVLFTLFSMAYLILRLEQRKGLHIFLLVFQSLALMWYLWGLM